MSEHRHDTQQVPVSRLSGADLGVTLTVPLMHGGHATGTLTAVEHTMSLSGTPQVNLRLHADGTTYLVTVDTDASVTAPTPGSLAEGVLRVCDARRIFTADVAGGHRAEGWHGAMDAVRKVVQEHQGRQDVSPADAYDQAVTAVCEHLGVPSANVANPYRGGGDS